jgi:D-serine deaminase-like pyridoxal phosphate-dependent protein
VPSIADLPTPSLLLDLAKLDRNAARMRARMAGAPDVILRPHLKTAKNVDVALRVFGGAPGPITVSTLLEAEHFAAAGFRDILYAVGIAPQKLERVVAIRRGGVDLAIILDSIEAADAVSAAAQRSGDALPVLIEIDSDGHRAGVAPGDASLLTEIARRLSAGSAEPRGVMTHAGGASYDTADPAEQQAVAARERAAVIEAAGILRAAGFAAPVVSVGSTPTALSPGDLAVITEVRAGVYHFFDLVMAGLNICGFEDIAISVLATVIGHQRDKGWILVDAGWMAMSRDRGTARQAVDQGYGLVCDESGRPLPDLIMVAANQEHGILALRPGSAATLPDLPVGSLVRVLPNHACATAAQHDCYYVVEDGEITAHWPRFNGW